MANSGNIFKECINQCSLKIKVRHYHYVILFLTLALFLGIYSSLSMAIVSMTREPTQDLALEINTYSDLTNPDIILSAFFWAYLLPLITGAKLSNWCGPKWLLLITLLVGSVFNIVIPPMTNNFGSDGVIVCRVVQGLCQGFLFPSIDCLIKRWTPVSKRSSIKNIVYNGVILGTAVSMPLTGLIASSPNGWPMVFYIYGSVGIIWAMVFSFFIRNSPSEVDDLSVEERNYLESEDDADRETSTPWLSILTSEQVWAILTASIAHNWSTSTLLTQMPTYMYHHLNFDINEDGDSVALPYFAQLIVSLITVPLVEKCIAKNVASVTIIRKIATSVGLFLPGIFLMILAFADSSDQKLAIACLVISVGISVVAQSGYFVNISDLAPNHSSSMCTLVNVTATVSSILAPLTVGFLGNDKKSPFLWKYVFVLAAVVNIVGGIIYDLFASGEVQPWNTEDVDHDNTGFYEKFLRFFDEIKNSMEYIFTRMCCLHCRCKLFKNCTNDPC